VVDLRFKAIIWLHSLRLWRYRYSFINMALNSTLWVTIFLLGALMFMPKEELHVGMPLAFWGIAMWTIMSNSVWLIGAWTNFYISQGFVEEHMLVNISSANVLVGRVIPGLSVSTVAIILIYFILSAITGGVTEIARHPAMLIIGLLLLTIMSLSYGLILASISFRTGVPMVLLDLSNFIIFIIGGIATPVSILPTPIRTIAIIIPYSHPAEIVRYGAIGFETYLPLSFEMILSILIALAMSLTALKMIRKAEEYVRKHGVKAIGRM